MTAQASLEQTNRERKEIAVNAFSVIHASLASAQDKQTATDLLEALYGPEYDPSRVPAP